MRAVGGDDLSPFPADEFVLLQCARAVATGAVTDQIRDALAAVYDPADIVAVGLIVDFYVGLCNYVASADLPFESGAFVGWTPADDPSRGRSAERHGNGDWCRNSYTFLPPMCRLYD